MPVPHYVDEVREALGPSRKCKLSRLVHLLGGFIFGQQRKLRKFTFSPIAHTDFNFLLRDVLEWRNSDFLCQMVAVPIDIHVLAHFIQI
jgi:hypothetical protein